jgi:hypothetical protein
MPELMRELQASAPTGIGCSDLLGLSLICMKSQSGLDVLKLKLPNLVNLTLDRRNALFTNPLAGFLVVRVHKVLISVWKLEPFNLAIKRRLKKERLEVGSCQRGLVHHIGMDQFVTNVNAPCEDVRKAFDKTLPL